MLFIFKKSTGNKCSILMLVGKGKSVETLYELRPEDVFLLETEVSLVLCMSFNGVGL